MGTTPPTDLSQYPGSAPSAVPVVEGRSCPTCRSPMRDGGICLCTPTVSKSSHAQSSPILRKKTRRRKQQHAAETAVTPSDVSKSQSVGETQESQLQLRRQLFKPESSSNLEVTAEPGTSSAAGTSTASHESNIVADISGSSQIERKTAATASSRTRHLCPRCPKSFSSPGKLSQHMYSHTGERPFVCQHCTKAFSSKFKLVRHTLIHSDLRQYICPICEKTFHRKDHLKNHAKVHNPVKSLYACERPGCGKEYSSLLNYRKHVAVHAAEDGNLECTMCGLKFSTKEEIIFHLKVHAGSRTVKTEQDRKYRCDWCNRSFFTGKDVRRHMVVHTKKRDFLCQYCPQRFGRKDHLVRHIKKSHNSTGKKTKTKRPEAKTKSVSSIIAETSIVNPSDIEIVKGDMELLKNEKRREVSFSHIEAKPSVSSEEDILSQPSTSILQPDASSIIFTSASHPSASASPPAYSVVVSSFEEIKPESGYLPEDIKPEIIPEYVSIEHLSPLMMLPDTSQLQPHPSQYLTADEPHQISRHIMNLTAPGSSSDPDLLIPEFMNPTSDQSTPSSTTPLPRFNQAFHQQPP
ncbi:uncharacterized protein LOC142318216 [Lycorma delicatula]|uniref:uncharacterized protein LOC142318216 n=1 Tax=Lycorma delicatula TaxID=130591 RepID=UPI003F515893